MGRVTDLVFVMWFKMVMDWRVWIMMVYMMNLVWRWRMWMRMVWLMLVYRMNLVRVRVRMRLVGIEDMFMMLMKNTFRMLMVFMMSMFRMIWNGFRMMMRLVMINMIKVSMGNILSSFWIDWWQRSLCNLIDSMNDFCSIRRFIVI